MQEGAGRSRSGGVRHGTDPSILNPNEEQQNRASLSKMYSVAMAWSCLEPVGR